MSAKSNDSTENIPVKDSRASSGADDTTQARESTRDAEDSVPAVDFTTFVLSLSTSAIVHLGAMPNPQSGKTEINLALARQTIDLLALLEQKTVGNLTGEEERLLSQVLYDLRMQFVASTKSK